MSLQILPCNPPPPKETIEGRFTYFAWMSSATDFFPKKM